MKMTITDDELSSFLPETGKSCENCGTVCGKEICSCPAQNCEMRGDERVRNSTSNSEAKGLKCLTPFSPTDNHIKQQVRLEIRIKIKG